MQEEQGQRGANLRGAAGGVHEHHAVAGDVGRVQGADEELVVCAVDGVAALERHDVGAGRQRGAHVSGAQAGEHPAGAGSTA